MSHPSSHSDSQLSSSSPSSSSSKVDATSWSSTADILQSIFSFLTFREFMHSAIHVSHIWYQQAARQPSYEESWPFPSRDDLSMQQRKMRSCPQISPFLIHLTTFSYHSISERYTNYTDAIDSIIELTKNHLTNLTSLDLKDNLAGTHKHILSLLTHTPRLRSCELSIEPRIYYIGDLKSVSDEDFTNYLSKLTSVLASSCPELESLALTLRHAPRQANFEPEPNEDDLNFRVTRPTEILTHLHSLNRLHTLKVYYLKPLTQYMNAEDFMLLQSFPALTSITMSYQKRQLTPPAEMIQLLAPNELKSCAADTDSSHRGLTTLPYGGAAVLLSSLDLCRRWSRSLKTLYIGSDVKSIDQECFVQFMNLTELSVDSIDANMTDLLIEGLCQMKHMRMLSLRNLALSSDQLIQIVSSLPLLRGLCLTNLIGLASLVFLRSIASRSITRLMISQFAENETLSQMSSDEIHHLLDSHTHLRHLEQLHLKGFSDSSPLSKEIVASLTHSSPSFDHARFPYLRQTFLP